MGDNLRILVLDDNAEDRFQVAREIAQEFPEAGVERVSSAPHLAEVLQRGGFDLVITDYDLGWTDGIEILRRVKAGYPEVPVIMFTGTGSEEVAVEAMKEGLDDYILKSARHLKRLSASVRSALERAEARRKAAAWEAERVRLEGELRRRADELTQESRKKDDFLAILGHELRNPLGPIRNAVQLLRRPDVSGEEGLWALDMVDRQVARMARLIDDLLDVSRIARGTIELRTERLDLTEVVPQSVDACRQQAEARRHVLSMVGPNAPIFVEADPIRLEQVVCNLLDNAVKYTPPGGRIEVRLGRAGGSAEVRVSDNGAGIAPDWLDRVFEPFLRADRSTGGASQWGLGVGLSLARDLVRLHGGDLVAASEGPGRGSEFLVRLPVADAPASPSIADRKRAEVKPSPLRLLVVDDSEDAANSLARLLRRSGHEVRVAYDGARALVEAPTFRPDAVLLDIGMPEMDGFEVAARLRTTEELDGAVLIAVTGWGQAQDRARAAAAGFDHHMVKPVDPAALNATLASIRPRRV